MIQPINKNFTLTPDYRRVHSKEASNKTKIAAAIGAAGGTALAVACFAKKQRTSFLDINYSLKEMAAVGLGSVAGGVLGGCFDV